MDHNTLTGIALLQACAAEAAQMLRLLANENRLLLLCHMAGHGEITVGELTSAVGLSQSAVSQHLAMLREAGLVATRREAQSIHYRLSDPRATHMLHVLKELYCPDNPASMTESLDRNGAAVP